MSVVARIVVDADPHEAWSRWSDISRWPEWNPRCLAATADGTEEGDQIELQLRHPRGRDFWTRPRVTVSEPGREFTWQARGLGVRASTQALFSAVDDGTEVQVTGDARGVLAFTWRLLITQKVEGRLLSDALNGFATDLAAEETA